MLPEPVNVTRELQELSPDLPADVLTEDELEAELLNMLDRYRLANDATGGSLDAGDLAVSILAHSVSRQTAHQHKDAVRVRFRQRSLPPQWVVFQVDIVHLQPVSLSRVFLLAPGPR
jgi:hypothetical protein